MDISIFNVLGPVMIGPSSSHTAGAAKLANTARMIAAKPFSKVRFGLHGSFAQTYKGHGTDKALVAGVLGISEKDERLIESFDIAKERNLEYEFYEVELNNVHENTVKFTFFFDNGKEFNVVGSSVGGGEIVIRQINDFETHLSCVLPTIVIKQHDKKGVLSDVSAVLAENNINIGTLSLSRTARDEEALCIIEVDGEIPENVSDKLRAVNNVMKVMTLNLLEGDN